eukprot:scaffold1231_cov187-Pinguiococcus_pyrenoidosus.AAC.23
MHGASFGAAPSNAPLSLYKDPATPQLATAAFGAVKRRIVSYLGEEKTRAFPDGCQLLAEHGVSVHQARQTKRLSRSLARRSKPQRRFADQQPHAAHSASLAPRKA